MTTENTTAKDKAPLASHANGHAAAEAKPPPALPIDLAALSDEVFALLAAEVPREAERRRARLIESMESMGVQARLVGLTPLRLVAALRPKGEAAPVAGSGRDGRSDVKPLYRNPVTGETWAGRGQPPAWIEFGPDTRPPRKPGGDPIRIPLPKFLISEQQKNGDVGKPSPTDGK